MGKSPPLVTFSRLLTSSRCGQPNMYHLPYRCKVTGATSTKAVGTPKPPVWCENNPDGCTKVCFSLRPQR